MLYEWCLSKSDALSDRAASWLGGPWTLARLALACFAVCVFVRWPRYERIPAAHPPWFIEVLDWQTRHPLEKLPLDTMVPAEHRGGGFGTHLDKREPRQLLPLLGWATGLHFKIYLVANHVAGLAFFGLLAWLVRSRTGDAGIAALMALAYALCYAGAHFFDDYYLGDGVAIALLLATMAVRQPMLIGLCVALAGAADERAIVASVLTYAFWQIARVGMGQLSVAAMLRPSAQAWGVIGGWAAYLAWRAVLRGAFGLTTGDTDLANWPILLHHAARFPGNLLGVFGWLGGVVALGAAAAWAHLPRRAFWLLATLAAVPLVPALLVYDFERSLAYGFAVPLIACLIAGEREPRLLRLAVVAGFLGNAFLSHIPDTLMRLLIQARHWL
ncbi:MAG: hypothetical protein JNL39_19570 [Opitutaceae bacterium]|nr:hypothetical protein [Opitutaceae bacterium]